MTDIDRLLELYRLDRRYYPDFLYGLTDKEKQEYQSLYEKLSEEHMIVERLKKQIEFQRSIEPPNYNSSSLLYIYEMILGNK